MANELRSPTISLWRHHSDIDVKSFAMTTRKTFGLFEIILQSHSNQNTLANRHKFGPFCATIDPEGHIMSLLHAVHFGFHRRGFCYLRSG
jgi:hypothetical protein